MHRSRSPISRVAKDKGTIARVANPYSENKDSDAEDQGYTVVGPGEGGGDPAASEADTLVQGAVQHVQQTGYPSTRGVNKNKGVKKGVDVNERPNRKKGRKLIKNNPKPTKDQLLAEPITHSLYFKAAQDFTRDHTNHLDLNILHKPCADVCTPRGRGC